MKKALIAIGLSIFAFAASLVGMYVAMPRIAPDYVEAVRDSVKAAQAPVLLRTASSDTLATDSSAVDPSVTIAQLRDSLDTARDDLVDAEARTADLQEALKAAQQQLSAQEKSQLRTADLGRTLSKLEDESLKAILKRLELPVLERLYDEASGRERKRLLQSMPPDYAARFVGRLMTSIEGTNSESTAMPSAPVAN